MKIFSSLIIAIIFFNTSSKAIDFINTQDIYRKRLYHSSPRDDKKILSITHTIGDRVSDYREIDYAREATDYEKEIIFKAMMGSVIIHNSEFEELYLKADYSNTHQKYQQHLKALKTANKAIQLIWNESRLNKRYIKSWDQLEIKANTYYSRWQEEQKEVFEIGRWKALLTDKFINWYYEVLDVYGPNKTTPYNFYTPSHGLKETFNTPNNNSDSEELFRKYYTSSSYLVGCSPRSTQFEHKESIGKLDKEKNPEVVSQLWQDTPPKIWGEALPFSNPKDQIFFEHGGGLIHILKFLKGEASGSFLCGTPYGRRGLQVSPFTKTSNLQARLAEYALNILPRFFDYPTVLVGCIERKYLDSQENDYEAGIRYEHFDKIKVLFLQPLPLRLVSASESDCYKAPNLEAFLKDGKSPYKKSLSQLSVSYQNINEAIKIVHNDKELADYTYSYLKRLILEKCK